MSATPNFQPYRTAYAPSDRNILNTVENFANLKIANTHFNLDSKNRPIATIIPHNPFYYFSYSSPLSLINESYHSSKLVLFSIMTYFFLLLEIMFI